MAIASSGTRSDEEDAELVLLARTGKDLSGGVDGDLAAAAFGRRALDREVEGALEEAADLGSTDQEAMQWLVCHGSGGD